MSVSLKHDQREVVNDVYRAIKSGHRSILMQSATGSGKSYMISQILSDARSRGWTTWMTVPRRNLLMQMHKTYQKFDMPHSYIASGKSWNPNAQAHICSTETIKRRLDKLQAPKLAGIDETHFGGNGLGTIIEWLKANGTIIIGASATPWLLDGTGLGKWYDHMVQGKSIRWLIDNKRLSDYRPFAPTHIDLTRVRVANGDYVQRDLRERMESDNVIVGDAVRHYKENAYGRLGIAYCCSIEHSEKTAAYFNDNGVPAAHIDGTTPENKRKAIIKAYANRELLYLTNCELLTFGFDLASQVGRDVTIEVESDLRPTKSLSLQMQKWGRVLRMKDEPAFIFDHANNFREHGMPCDNRYWTLEDRVMATGMGGEGGTIPNRHCPICFLPHKPSPKCPSCGHEYEIEGLMLDEVDGILEELRVKNIKKANRMEVGMAKTFDDLRRIQKERGYKQSWVFQMAKAKGIKN